MHGKDDLLAIGWKPLRSKHYVEQHTSNWNGASSSNHQKCHGNFTVSSSLAFARQTDESAGTEVLSLWKRFWQLGGGDGFFQQRWWWVFHGVPVFLLPNFDSWAFEMMVVGVPAWGLYVGLAKLHCSATPPAAMVLFLQQRWWWWVFLPQAPPSSHTGPPRKTCHFRHKMFANIFSLYLKVSCP